MKTLIKQENELSRCVAEQLRQILSEKPDAVLALTAGRSTAGVYRELADMCRTGQLSFSRAKVFAVTEYVDAKTGHSCRDILKAQLLDLVDIPKENCFFPDSTQPESYDEAIETAGGIDLCLLGIGINAHIGYNEPATPFDSHTHVQKLTDATHRQYAGSDRELTEYAVTMGIKNIVSSRNILLVASGADKADAVFKMIYGKTETYIPASFLQIPPEVTVYADPAAAGKL